MKVITRQFTKEILLATSFVLMALVALFAFFELINQLEDVGKDYTIGTAFLLTALTLPARIYEVMPLAVLLAAVYIMSRWAANSEFTVLRVAGLSPQRLALGLMVPGLILVMLTYAFGEFVAPWAERYSLEVESAATNSQLEARGYFSGVWVRDVTEDEKGKALDRYINVKNLSVEDARATGAWRMFEFDGDGRLLRMIRAESAVFDTGRGWELKNAVIYRYPLVDRYDDRPTASRIEKEEAEHFFLASQVGPEILGVMTTKPENMSMRDLDRYVSHLSKNNQQSEHYRIAHWTKAFYPLAIFVMLALSMPFAYMNARSGGVAIKIFLGVMIGIAFYALNNLFSYLGILNTWSPIAVSVTPTVVMLLAGGAAMYVVERR